MSKCETGSRKEILKTTLHPGEVGRQQAIALHKDNVRFLEMARGLAKFSAKSLVVS
jgi:hypothetical protein